MEAERTGLRSAQLDDGGSCVVSVMASRLDFRSILGLLPELPRVSIIFFNDPRRVTKSLLGAVVILFSLRTNSGFDMNSSFGVSPSLLPWRMPLLKSSSIFLSFSFRSWSILGSTCFRVAVTFLCALRMTSVGSASDVSCETESASFIQGCCRASAADARFLGSCSRTLFTKSRACLLSFAFVCHFMGSVRILTMMSRGCFASYG
mmetsp:Transcript_48661/g.139056  ORF Transcript_48661/g.139056 Transcript_48661/m.139056 type:complete len:205 (+) Transcript_48661:319-933(+)